VVRRSPRRGLFEGQAEDGVRAGERRLDRGGGLEEGRVVGIAQQCGSTAANVSRHLSLLAQRGMVVREGRGTSVYYRIADPSIYALCDLVCGSIARKFEQAALEQMSFARAGAGRPQD
jgi:DNA-binding transcriptional ArsR family regulator